VTTAQSSDHYKWYLRCCELYAADVQRHCQHLEIFLPKLAKSLPILYFQRLSFIAIDRSFRHDVPRRAF
jgi:hypothetical protein